MKKLYELSATELLAKMHSHAVSVTEVAQAFIDRITEVNPLINAIIQFDPERILREAKQADEAIYSGKKLGKLHGLPMTMKDAFYVEGFRCCKGFPGFLSEPSKKNATVVTRLKAEGAIILGITNVPELLLSFETDNLIYGRTNNPYDLSRTPGGSSGGEAAIIAAGGSPLGIGTDAGGSIRIPAHYSGICGHKPTKGYVPFTGNIPFDGATGLTTQRITMGPMAHYVEDLSLIMPIISGTDYQDPYVPPVAAMGNPDKVNIKTLRVGYFFDIKETTPCKQTVNTLNIVIENLRSEVASLIEVFPKFAADIYRLHWETLTIGGDKGEKIKQLFKKFGQTKMSPLIQVFLEEAEKHVFSLTEFHQRFIEIEKFRYAMFDFMKEYDVLISPVAATPAKKHGETSATLRDFSYVFIQSLSGFPATVVPCGQTKDGLPIGIQITSYPWQDHVGLAVAKKLQAIFGVPKIPAIK